MPLNRTAPYRGTLWANAAKTGSPRKFFPIPQIEDLCYGIEQDFQQHRNNLAALPLNTVHPDDATTFLQFESWPPQDRGNGLLQWTRRYYQIPPAWDDWENISYTFPQTPGYLTSPSGVAQNPQGRAPFTPVNGVTVRVHYDYFMVGTYPAGAKDAAGNLINGGKVYATEGDIPLIPVQTYVGKTNPTFYLDPPQVVDDAGAGGTVVGSVFYWATTPSKTLYFSWVTNAAANKWASGYDDGSGDWQLQNGLRNAANPGQIVISCKPQRIMGNLWARVTRYVLAQ